MTKAVAPFSPIDRRRFVQMCAGILTVDAMGCGRGGKRRLTSRSTITVLHPIDERGLGPAWEMPSKLLVFLPLAVRNAAGDMEGRLAERWEHSADYRTWTIHLRKSVRWHDGVPVTAHDIKFTLDLLTQTSVLWVPPGALSVTVLDDHTYTLTYHRRVYYTPLDGYTSYYPKHLLEKLDPKEFLDWEFWTHPVGNGPYRYVRTVAKTMIELEANPDYFRGKPRIERVVLKFGGEGESPLPDLMSANVDAAYVNQTDLFKMAGDPRFRVYYSIIPRNTTMIVWNQRQPLFRDPKVRRALTLAINRRELHQVLDLPQETPVFDGFATDRQFQRGELPEALTYDPAQAKRLLDEDGWRDLDGDGVRERNGRAFRFTALVATLEGGDRPAVFVQAQLRRLGIQMDVQMLDLAAGRQRVKAGAFEAAIVGVHDIATPGWFDHLAFFRSPLGSGSPELVKLVEAVQATMNPAEVDRLYRELAPIFRAELPMTFLYPQVAGMVAHRRVRGLSSPHRASPVRYIEDLWLEDEK